MMEMPKVLECLMDECAYNKEKKCHAMAITVGGGMCPLCDTFMKTVKKGGVADMIGTVGACKVENCQLNTSLECNAGGIRVVLHNQHAECATFKAK